MRYLEIQNGVVANVIKVENPSDFPQLVLVPSESGNVGDLWDGQVLTPKPTPGLSGVEMARRVEEAVMAVYSRPMLFSQEYVNRETAATAYKQAGYTGTVPARLAAFATAANMTAQAATDLILAQAAQLRGALDTLGDIRMNKYILTRPDVSEAMKLSTFNTSMATIASIATALG